MSDCDSVSSPYAGITLTREPLPVSDLSCICRREQDWKGGLMPRQPSLVSVIRDLVQQEVRSAIQSLLGGISTPTTKPTKNGRRRRRRRGTGRPGRPGRPPKAVGEEMAQ